ncbi:MAG: hypothetical protein R3F60_01145 [bacterium]
MEPEGQAAVQWAGSPRGEATIRLATALLLAAGLLVSQGCETEELVPPMSEGVSYVVPFGEVSGAEIERARWALEVATRRPVVLLPPQAVPRQADGAETDAAADFLDALIRQPPPDTFRILGLTSTPLLAEGEPVIGYSRIGERALVYSTFLLPRYATEAVRRGQARRIVAHELGHTYGAVHCEQSCVMRDAESGRGLDQLPLHYCPEHRALAEEALKEGPLHPSALVRLGAERMRLGAWTEAIDAYRLALRSTPGDYKARTAMGVALMARGELTAAEEAFVAASRSAPRAAQPYYARAVLYAAGVAPRRAPAFLEAAVGRDEDPRRAHRAAGILYQELLEDPAQAARHFQAHVSAGGRDPDVIARLVYLIQPTTLTFNEPETIIARWSPELGLEVAYLPPRPPPQEGAVVPIPE